MNKRNILRFVALLATIALLAVSFGSVMAITDGGVPDTGNTHPEVVLIIADVEGSPAFRCSGTLIAPTFVLTAGHCVTNFPDPGAVTAMRVFTEVDVDNGDNNYPFGGGNNTVEAVRWASHPLYETAPFFFNDVGMIELAEPIHGVTYGQLAPVGSLDTLATRRGRQNTDFTAVGYGLQRINPVFVESARVRHIANPRLIQINTPGFTGDFSLLLSNNASTGGTCFGDSGGPNYRYGTNIVAGITSFGINGNCAGTGGVFRTDKQNVHDFVYGFMNS